MDFETDLLRAFVAVADAQSFTRAGQAVSLTQSAVSQQIKRLEAGLGGPLFDRGGRAVRLTPLGGTFLPHARRILKVHAEAAAAVADPEMTGQVRLGTSDELAMCLLPELLRRFTTLFPRIQVDVLCACGNGLADLLARGEIDLYLNTSTRTVPGSEILAHAPLQWVSSRFHLAHREDPLPLALYQPGCSYREHAVAALRAADRPCRVALSSQSLAGIHAAVTAGMAVSLLLPASTPPDCVILGADEGLPPLPPANLHLVCAREMGRAARGLAEAARELVRRDGFLLTRTDGPKG